jgi:Mn-dependent DtxR family transcriptional regulator
VREKILTYLRRIQIEENSSDIEIPFDRSAMAEYLNVERSALSRELSKMKTDGLIDYHKNRFTIY